MKQKLFTKAIAFSILLCSANLFTNAQPCIKSQHTLGGSGDDNIISVVSTGGNSFVVCGSTNSADGDFNVPGNHGHDAFIVKYSSANHIAWSKTFGGTGDEYFQSITQTVDGGFIAVGATTSNDGDVSNNHGGDEDIWVVKFSASGNLQWQKCLGGSGDEFCYKVITTVFGYAISGTTNSTDGDIISNHGDYDAWIIRLSFNGNILWQHTFGGSGYDESACLTRNADGTYIFAGSTGSSDGDISGNHGALDTWIVKLSALGNIIWNKIYGGSSDEVVNASARTSDGNLVIAHMSDSPDGDVNGGGKHAAWLLKINQNNGNIIWSKPYNDYGIDWAAFNVFETADGGAIATGVNGDAADYESADAFILKVDASGNKQWDKILAGSNTDSGNNGFETGSGSFIIVGNSLSSDGDFTNARGGFDSWIAKFGNCGNSRLSDNEQSQTVSVSSFVNPIIQSTTISFSLTESQNVSMMVFDLNGRLIEILADNIFEEGEHQIEFNAEKINAGIYFLKMHAGEFLKMEKLIVTK